MKNLFYISIVLIFIASCTRGQSTTRKGVLYQPIMFRYEYDESLESRIGIPSGTKSFRTNGNKTIGIPILVATGRELVDEKIKGKEMRLIKVSYSFFNVAGQEISKSVVWFRPQMSNAYVVKVLINNQYQSFYNWTDLPGYSLASMETFEINTGKKVHEVKNLSGSSKHDEAFQGTELFYDDGKIICEISFIRHIGTGLLIEESVNKGKLPYDYHPYEFVLAGWPSGK